jgi:sarcosine oxidase
MDTDVAVVGVGAIGAMALRALARRGVAAVGIDRSQPGHDDAAYGGGTRQVRLVGRGVHADVHQLWIEESLSLWAQFANEIRESFYTPCGNLAVGPADDPDIASTLASLERTGLRHEVYTPATVGSRFPQHRLAVDEIAIFMPDGGVLRSNRAVSAAAGAAVDGGAQLVRGEVTEVVETSAGVTLRIAESEVRARHVILTAGPWTTRLCPKIAQVVTPRVVPSVWVPSTADASFDPDSFPPGVRRSRDGFDFTFLPAVDGAAAKFVLWNPMRPAIELRESRELPVERDIVDGTLDALAHTMKGASGAIERANSYVEGFSADRWPIVARLDDRTTVLTGFSGSGFALAPAMGEAAADLALTGSSTRDLSSFELSRESLQTTAAAVARQGAI